MLRTDKLEFTKAMISCFQNYRANISDEMIDEWFESKLRNYPLFNIKKAFNNYMDNYRNKFPPTRGAIIQLAIGGTLESNRKEESSLGCANIISGERCGKEIFVHRHCYECYDSLRPKTDMELKFEAHLRKDREDAIAEGCVTPEDFLARTKQKLSQSAFGKRILETSKKWEQEKLNRDRDRIPELSPEAKALKKNLDESSAGRISENEIKRSGEINFLK